MIYWDSNFEFNRDGLDSCHYWSEKAENFSFKWFR